MLRYAVRRLLWSIPTLLATTFVLFMVTTLASDAPAPVPAGAEPQAMRNSEADGEGGDVAEAIALRARFLDLPRFLNVHPVDVRSLAANAIAHIAAGDPHREASRRDLVRLGGAALPYVLPELEGLAPDARRRVAVALAPLAERMGVGATADLQQPETAALFWTRFWEDRALDFTPAAVDRAVTRLVEHASDLREDDLSTLDTFALPAILRALNAQSDGAVRERLMRLASHATGRGPALSRMATPDAWRRAIARWNEWWFVVANDFVALSGTDRALALVTDTRYGKWLKRIATGQLGVSVIDGEPVASKLLARGPVTLLVCALAMLASWIVAIPIGVLGAWWRGRTFDVATSAVLFVLYATPTFAVAELLRRAIPRGWSHLQEAGLALGVAALAAGSMATLSRWQRTAMLDVLGQEFVRTARAKGVPEWRVLTVHALRNALFPTIALAGTHLPALLGGAIVVEEIFSLPGAGYETLRAIEAHDVAWLMGVLLAAAVAITLGLLASDVALGLLDPRVRELLTARQGRS